MHSGRDLMSGRSHPDSGIDPDALSVESSVSEYLASLGVAPLPKGHLNLKVNRKLKAKEVGYKSTTTMLMLCSCFIRMTVFVKVYKVRGGVCHWSHVNV